VDPLDHEDLVLEFDFPLGVAAETTVPGGDAACFQRTPERAGQSTGGGRHHVIEGGGVRFEAALVGAVVLGDGAVDPEGDDAFLGGEVGVAQGTASSLDVDFRPVHDVSHSSSSSHFTPNARQRTARTRTGLFLWAVGFGPQLLGAPDAGGNSADCWHVIPLRRDRGSDSRQGLGAGLQGVEGIVTRRERVSLVMTRLPSWSVLRFC
jgi:hypothetical protein